MELIDVMRDQIVRLVAVVFFALKFFIFAMWYRCSTYGNILERTGKVFWYRQLCDLLLYAFIGYNIYLEYVSTSMADPSVQEAYTPKGALAQWITDRDQDQWQTPALILLITNVVKEIFVYFMCVRRASNKLKKERQESTERSEAYVSKATDNFVREN